MAIIMTKSELANALEGIGIENADDAADGLIYLGMVKVISSPIADAMSELGFAPFQTRALEKELEKRGLVVTAPMHPHLANALERARAWAVDFTKYPKIWCSNCVAVMPFVADEMPPDRANKHGAVDLLCGECRYIVATLHEASK